MRVLLVSFFIVFFDQLSKLLVKGISLPSLDIIIDGLALGESVQVIGTFLRISFIENSGLVFGIGVGDQTKVFISILTILASVGLLIYLYINRNEKLLFRIGIASMVGGAIGNLIDRMFYGLVYQYDTILMGNVVDWIDFDFFDIELFGRLYERAPIFNIADFAIFAGVIFILSTTRSRHTKKTEKVPVGDRIDSEESSIHN